MAIDLLINPQLDTLVLPGNQHTYDRPLGHPTGASRFRITMTVIVGDGPERDGIERGIQAEHRRPPGEPYGIVLLESQIMSAMMITDADTVRRNRAGGPLPADAPVYGGWPNSIGWEEDELTPHTTWNPGGVGVIDTYDNVAGGTVTVYEYRVDKAQNYNDRNEPSGEMVNMVAYHCDRCHTPDNHDFDGRFENRFPSNRAWAAKQARAHARGNRRCKIPDGRIEEVVAKVMSEKHGRPVVLPSRASRCATELAGCGGVREARAATARLTGGAG